MLPTGSFGKQEKPTGAKLGAELDLVGFFQRRAQNFPGLTQDDERADQPAGVTCCKCR